MNYIKFLNVLIAILIGQFASAQQSQNKSFFLRIIHANVNSPKPDSLKLRFANDYYPDIEKFEDVLLLPDSTGDISFRKQISESMGIMYMYIYYGKKPKLINGVTHYFITQGDSVSVTIHQNKNGLNGFFNGTGSAKYNCKNIISEQQERYLTSEILYSEDLAGRKQLTDDCIAKGLYFLQNKKTELADDIFQLLMIENTSFYYSQWIANVSYYYQKNPNDDLWKRLLNIYEKYTADDPFLKNKNISYSDYGLLNQLNKTQFYLLLESNNEGYSYRELFKKIKENYDGATREKLVAMCLFNVRSFKHIKDFEQEQFIHCVEDALTFVKSSYIKENIHNLLNYRKGAVVYNFSLTDLQDKKISLKDLKGKVILLDFWGKGCTGCASFYQRFKKNIYPFVKDNPDFNVVSVSIDEDKATWVEGIDGGKYTSREHINLYTEGKGINHPFTQYYNLRAIPFILIIDKGGKLYTKVELGFEDEKIVSLIKEALSS